MQSVLTLTNVNLEMAGFHITQSKYETVASSKVSHDVQADHEKDQLSDTHK